MTSTYLYVRGRVLGPFSPVDIRAWRLEQGALGEETLVWNWHTNAWIPIDGFLRLQVAPAGPRRLAMAPVSTASSQGNTVSRTEPNVVKVIAVLVTILGVILLMIAVLPEPGPARSDPNVDSVMTSCMREAINSSGGNHAAAILKTQSLIDCAQSELGASTEWSCDDEGCWRDDKGYTWIRILSGIENPDTQVPAGESAEEDYVLWCQQELGMGEDECRSIWQNT